MVFEDQGGKGGFLGRTMRKKKGSKKTGEKGMGSDAKIGMLRKGGKFGGTGHFETAQSWRGSKVRMGGKERVWKHKVVGEREEKKRGGKKTVWGFRWGWRLGHGRGRPGLWKRQKRGGIS